MLAKPPLKYAFRTFSFGQKRDCFCKRFVLINFILLTISISPLFSQNVGINDDGTTPNDDALLHIHSSSGDKGFLIPRLTLDDSTNTGPVTNTPISEGLLIYNQSGTEAQGYYYWDGNKWSMLFDETEGGYWDRNSANDYLTPHNNDSIDMDGENIVKVGKLRFDHSDNPTIEANTSFGNMNYKSPDYHNGHNFYVDGSNILEIHKNTSSGPKSVDFRGHAEFWDGHHIYGKNQTMEYKSDNTTGHKFYASGSNRILKIENASPNRIHVDGDVDASGSKNFVIDHPKYPDRKKLYHAAIESNQPYNQYSGKITTNDQGIAKVDLPDYVPMINKNYRYNLTVIGKFAQAIVKEEMEDGSFVIATSEPNTKVSWQLTGVRDDKRMREHPYKTVRPKNK